MESADPVLRWARAAALATVASLVAVWAHVGAAGHLPAASVLLLVVGALTLAAHPLLARPASTVRVLLLTVGGQALAHAALSVTAGHRGDPVTTAAPAHDGPAGHHDHPGTAHAAADVARPLLDAGLHLAADLASAGLPMLLSHLAAAVLVGAWLAAGERAVWTMVTLAWRALVLLVAQAVPGRPPATGARPVVVPLLVRVTAGSVVRRGPPTLLAA